MDGSEKAPAMTRSKGVIILVCIAIGVGFYFTICGLLGITAPYAGLLFSLYWGAIMNADKDAFIPSLLGFLGGLLLAALLHILPAEFGTAGLVGVMIPMVLAIYCYTMGWARIVVNNGFMLMLTVATIPPIHKEATFVGMAGSILFVGAVIGTLLFVSGQISQRKVRTVTTD